LYEIINETAVILELRGIADSYCYEDGTLKDCILNEANVIKTRYGELIPKYGHEEARTKYNHSISFYKSGAVKSIAMEKQTNIITILGTFPAELVTFYESGALKRLFPLNGKISGYWTETDEEQLCEVFQFRFPFGSFKAKIISLCFYENGNLKALTLWPGETVILKNKADLYPVRIGFSLYEDGGLKSVEPAYELTLATPIGNINAFDENALGICGETNSLCFKKNGTIHSLTTSSSKIAVFDKDGTVDILEPALKPDPLEEDKFMIIPLKITFEGHHVKFEGDTTRVYDLYTSRFSVANDSMPKAASGFSCGDCSSCSLCK
jgi:hypothetical protein